MTLAVDDFDGFYQAHFGDTVAMTYGYTADLAAAQDIAQEAFCRAWQRWQQVSRYENPVAWVRRVALNLAHSRWRQLKVATGHLIRQRPPSTPPLDPDHVAVVAALRKLPAAQRAAIVLHHMMDLPVVDVAEHLDVPVNTVKSWLHRGRTVLAADLDINVRQGVKTPPVGEVAERGLKQQRRRRAMVAGVLVLLLVGVVAAIQWVRPRETPPPLEPTPIPSKVDPIMSVGWASATIDFDIARAGCPGGRVSFERMPALGAWGPARKWPRMYVDENERPTFGDLNGDGRAEAVLDVSCQASENGPHEFNLLLIVECRPDGSLHSLGWAGRPDGFNLETWIEDGVLLVDAQPQKAAGDGWDYWFGRVEGWRWDGAGFAAVDTSDSYPRVFPLSLDLGRPFVFDENRRATSGDQECVINPFDVAGDNIDEPHWLLLGRSSQPYLVLTVGCRPVQSPVQRLVHSSAGYSMSLLVLDQSRQVVMSAAILGEGEPVLTHFHGRVRNTTIRTGADDSAVVVDLLRPDGTSASLRYVLP